MPGPLRRFFATRSPRIAPDVTWGLRLTAELQRPGRALRALEATCRLLLRGPCEIALVCTRPQQGRVRILAGRSRARGDVALAESLRSTLTPLGHLGDDARFTRLADNPLQPAAPFLRRYDQLWALALPFAADLGEGTARYVFLACGSSEGVDPRHPLIQQLILAWRAARAGLERTAPHEAAPAVAASEGLPDADLWNLGPVALAVVNREEVLAVNPRARDLLDEVVGGEGVDWRPWLVGLAGRLLDDGGERCVAPATPSRRRCLEVAVGPPVTGGGGWVVALRAAPCGGEADDADVAAGVLGHELRTPLAAMRSSLSLVLRGDAGAVTADQERFLVMCRRNLDRFDRLLTDLLDARRAAAGHLRLAPAARDVAALLREDLDLLEVSCRDHGISLDATGVPASFEAWVDADKFLRMFHNVAGNAVKYTPRGGLVRVSLEAHARELPGLGAVVARRFGLGIDAFALVVEDSGLGMSEEFVARLFTPYGRDGRVESRRLPGAGLGLHITRDLAEAHGGDVRVVSRPGEGTTVWLALPRREGGARLLVAGRELEQLVAQARACDLSADLVALDLRPRPDEVGDLDAAVARARDFLGRLARESAAAAAALFVPTPERLVRELAPGLVVGVCLDPARLAAAWEVVISAPRCGEALTGRRWQLLEEAGAPAPDIEPCPVGG